MLNSNQTQLDSFFSAPTVVNPEVLLANDLRKSYGPRPALRGLSFSLHAGHVLGFLGPNGAGKTTAIRIMTTILKPDSGYFAINGTSYENPEKIRNLIGVLPESMGFPKHLTGFEYLIFFSQIYGRSKAEAKVSAGQLLEELGMGHRANSLIGSYSRGMRQRLGIARALINNPKVVFLDEPTLGLDPHGQQELLDLIRKIARQRNAGVVLCSHLLADIEAVCDDVVILNLGQVVAKGPVNEVVGRARQNLIHGNVLRILVPQDRISDAQVTLEKIPQVANVTPMSDQNGWFRVEPAESAIGLPEEENYFNNNILNALIEAQIPILDFGILGGRLQDVFFQVTTEVKE